MKKSLSYFALVVLFLFPPILLSAQMYRLAAPTNFVPYSARGVVTANQVSAYSPVYVGSFSLTGPVAPVMATAAGFALFSSSGAVANSGPTVVRGNVGTNLGTTTGFTTGLVSGIIHPTTDASTIACAIDLHNIYLYLNALPYDILLPNPPLFGNGLVLTPHTYLLNAATTLTDTLFLDAGGNVNAIFVIQINGAFITSNNAQVVLRNGTQAKNVFWKIEGAVIINDATVFNGIIVCNNAAVLINNGATLYGSAFTTTGAITTISATINAIPPIIIATTQTWVGVTSADWQTGSNWASGIVPQTIDTVVINTATYQPEIAASAIVGITCLTLNAGASLSLDALSVVHLSGNMANSGNILGNGTISLSGTTVQTIKGIGMVNNIELNNSMGASIYSYTDTLTITGNLTLTAGVLSTYNNLILSMCDDPIINPATGRIAPIVAGGGAIMGKVIVQQCIKGDRRAYRFWGTPFADTIALSQLENFMDITGPFGAAHGFTSTGSNNSSAYRYQSKYGNSGINGGAGDPGWMPFTWCTDSFSSLGSISKDSNLVHPYQGFRLFFRGAKGQGIDGLPYSPQSTSVKMWGRINMGTINVPMQKGLLTTTTGYPLQDYNMISNPYPSPIDIGAVVHNAYIAGQLNGGTFWVWNPFGATAGMFVSQDEATYTPYIISANTAFQVRAANNGSVLHFEEANKAATLSIELLKTKANYQSLNIYDSAYHIWDLWTLHFLDLATDENANTYNAGKPANPDLNFYSWSADHNALCRDVRQFRDGTMIQLGLSSNFKQTFILKVDNYNLAQDQQLYLHDKYLHKSVLLNEGTEYKFTITDNPNSQGNDRFELAMQNTDNQLFASSPFLKVLLMPNPVKNTVSITYSTLDSAQTRIKIVSPLGVCVYNKDLGKQQSGNITIAVDTLVAGIYMVEFTSGNERVLQRLMKE